MYLVVPDSESAVGTLRMHQDCRHCRYTIHHPYANTLAAERLASKAVSNVLVTPLHWMTTINLLVGAAT